MSILVPTAGGGSGGNVVGPGSSTAGNVAVFADASGELLASSPVEVLDGFLFDAGRSVLTGNATNDTATMAATGLTATLSAGRSYGFRLVLFAENSTAADGIKIDFDGGAATAQAFRAHGLIHDASLETSAQVSALATDIAGAAITGASLVVVEGAIITAAEGTFIPRFAMNADSGGTLTLYAGSYLLVYDMGSGGG